MWQICLRSLVRFFREAFDFKSIFGGFAGSCMVWGVKRGLFSNEAGMGSAPNAAASADVSHPCQTGACSGHLCIYRHHRHLLYDGIYRALYRTVYGRRRFERHSAGTAVCTVYVPERCESIITVSVALFAFTSLIGNYFYAEFNIKFISENKLSSLCSEL